MDRASEAAARDLAEIRKLIEGMSAFVNSQAVQQQSPQVSATATAALQDAITKTLPSTVSNQCASPQTPILMNSSSASSSPSSNTTLPQDPNRAVFAPNSVPTASEQVTTSPTGDSRLEAAAQPQNNGVVVEVNHLLFNRTLYFQLSSDATIEPLIAWLRLSFADASVSGMVLQYKGFDGLWKCLLNRDDSLRRVLKQTQKARAMLQMRVPREQDLLSSGYTDRRLLALTKPST